MESAIIPTPPQHLNPANKAPGVQTGHAQKSIIILRFTEAIYPFYIFLTFAGIYI